MKYLPYAFAAILLLASCGGGQETVKESSVEKMPAPKKLSAPLIKGSELSEHEGQTVTVIAKQSEIIHQHMILLSFKDERDIYYIDLEDGYQIVAYALKPVPCNGKFKVTGTAGVVSGQAKSGKGDYSEPYILVDNWECLE